MSEVWWKSSLLEYTTVIKKLSRVIIALFSIVQEDLALPYFCPLNVGYEQVSYQSSSIDSFWDKYHFPYEILVFFRIAKIYDDL